MGADGAPVPDLAQGWEAVSPTRWRFHLRSGLEFADGSPLTSEDVRATLASVASPDSRSFRHADFLAIAAIEVHSALDLDVVLTEPFAPLLANLTLGILPASRLQGDAAGDVGAGPYRLAERRPEQEFVLEANPHFYGRAPRLTRIRLRIIPSETTRALELAKGSLDLSINDLPPDLVEQFRGDPAFQVLAARGASTSYLGLNLDDPLLAELAVRRALAMAIDRPALIQHLLRGWAVPATGLLPPGHWAYAATETPPVDPEEAAKILDAAGHPAPSPGEPRFRLIYRTSASDLANQQAQVIQEAWRRIGVETEIRSSDWPTFYDDVVHGRFQVHALTWTEVVDPDLHRLRFSSRHLPPDGLNRGRYRNADVDALLEAGVRASSQEERIRIYSEVQRRIAADVAWIPLYHRDHIAVARARVHGITLTPTADFRALADIELDP
jgi:peptide/nickel transport system substrate-binding protein